MRKHLPIAMAVVAAALVLAGCEMEPFPLLSSVVVKSGKPEPKDESEQPPPSAYLQKVGLRSKVDEADDGAVGEAMAWMERYTKEVEKRSRIEKEKRSLEEQNRELAKKADKLEGELKQAQQELDEANAMMLRLNADLKAWKKDVLGYRDEMRAAHTQTVTALGRILQLLGGEVPSSPLAARATPPGSASTGSTPKPASPAAKERTDAPAGS